MGSRTTIRERPGRTLGACGKPDLGNRFAESCAALERAHLKEFQARELKYYNMLLWRKRIAFTVGHSFRDPDGYNDFSPSAHYHSSVWNDVMQDRRFAKLDKLVRGMEGEANCSRELSRHPRQQNIDGKAL